MKRVTQLLLLPLAALASGCLSSFPQWEEASASPASLTQAARLVDASVDAHGGDVYATADEIRVEYEGEWGFLVTKVQPVLTDPDYRQSSTERFVPSQGLLEQTHRGPAGEKTVVRRPDSIEVRYDGVVSDDEDVRAAAALVADAYMMFLVGPSFVKHRATEMRVIEPETLDGRPHDRVLAKLEPGFGFSEADYVVLWIDAETRLTRRLHFTLEGLESTRGAHVDTTYLEYGRFGPFTFATDLVEHVRSPLPAKAHEWRVTSLESSTVAPAVAGEPRQSPSQSSR